MTEPNEPEKKDEAAEPTEDELIIDLSEEATVEPAGDEEAIKGDEEIIDLLHDVGEPSVTDLDETAVPEASVDETTDETKDDEEIIDLTSAVETKEPTEDEAVIDLVETDATALEIEDIGEPIPDAADSAQEFEDISGLDDDLIKEATGFANESASEATAGGALKPDFTDSLGIEMGSEEETKEKPFDPDKVSDEQVEAALERVIKKMFYEKIDRLLIDAIEKTVIKEIERLKKGLLDDATDNE